MEKGKRYRDLNSYYREQFGCRVQKVALDAGMTCPNRDGTISNDGCTYCNARGSGTGAYIQGMSISDQLSAGIARLTKRYRAKKFIAYFQSFSNTYAPLNRLRELYEEALSIPDVVGLSIGTRPDCINEGVLNLLQQFDARCLVWLELGLQSALDATLQRINRGHDFACFAQATRTARRMGIKVCAHAILGLPGEDRRGMLQTAATLSDLGIDGIKLHLLYVLRGTVLEGEYRSGRYQCLEQQAYVDLVCDFLERLPRNVVVQRLTGDPHPAELVAPAWSLRKTETLSLLQDALVQRDSWQGKLVD